MLLLEADWAGQEKRCGKQPPMFPIRFVFTVEPGIYFIPQLISRWKAERKFTDFICYDRLEAYQDFGGIRIEENVVMASAGGRILGKKRPRTIDEVEILRSLK
jgi:Xaa-Pro aminopeptidase